MTIETLGLSAINRLPFQVDVSRSRLAYVAQALRARDVAHAVTRSDGIEIMLQRVTREEKNP
jgi:hypothetical protein